MNADSTLQQVDEVPRSILLRTAIPGPQSQALLDRRAVAVPDGLYKAHPIAIAKAQGGFVTDVDGNVFMDFVSGIGTTNIGHNDVRVVEAIQRQAEKLLHFGMLVGTYEPYVALCERLNALVPIPGPVKTLLSNSGAEGVENAVKIARHVTGRPGLIVFEGAYHGRTLMTLSMTSKVTFKKGFGPFVPEIYRAPFPSAYRMGLSEAEATARCIEALDRMLLATVAPETVAAIVIEPVLGEGGFLPVPPAFWEYLRKTCDKHGMLLIADEVQCGFGRTGKIFACERFVSPPDILVSAKSIANGIPLAATTGRAALMDKVHVGGIGGTFGGNPVACAAALAVLDILEEGSWQTRADAFSRCFVETTRRWHSEIPLLGDARNLGPMMALELVRDRGTREPVPDETLEVIGLALHKGLLLMRAGLYANCIRLLPSFALDEAQLIEGLAILEVCLKDVSARRLGIA